MNLFIDSITFNLNQKVTRAVYSFRSVLLQQLQLRVACSCWLLLVAYGTSQWTMKLNLVLWLCACVSGCGCWYGYMLHATMKLQAPMLVITYIAATQQQYAFNPGHRATSCSLRTLPQARTLNWSCYFGTRGWCLWRTWIPSRACSPVQSRYEWLRTSRCASHRPFQTTCSKQQTQSWYQQIYSLVQITCSLVLPVFDFFAWWLAGRCQFQEQCKNVKTFINLNRTAGW